MANASPPGIAILGAGIFVKTQYIPRLAEISDLVNLKAIWSRSEVTIRSLRLFWEMIWINDEYVAYVTVKNTPLGLLPYHLIAPDRIGLVTYGFCLKESAKGAVEVARKHFPGVECKWGDEGLNEIIQDSSILGVAVVIAGQTQVYPLII